MHAYANPGEGVKGIKDRVNRGAAGHGIIRFNKKDRTVTFECWPRFADVTDPDAEQFAGWPVTVQQKRHAGK